MKKFILILIVSTIYFMLVKSFVSIYSADIYYTRSRDLVEEVRFSDALKFVNKAIKQNPLEPAYYRGRAKILTLSALYSLGEEDKFNLKKAAYEDLQRAFGLNISNLATIRNSIPLYYYLSLKNISENESFDHEYLVIAQRLFENVKIKYPNDVGVYIAVAKYEKKLGLEEDLDKTLTRIRELRPDLLEWHEDLR